MFLSSVVNLTENHTHSLITRIGLDIEVQTEIWVRKHGLITQSCFQSS